MTNNAFYYSEEAEKSIIGSCILNSDIIPEILDKVSPRMFALDKNKKVFEAIISLENLGQAPDPLTLNNKLYEMNYLNAVGHEYLLNEVMEEVFTWVNYKDYIKILKDRYKRRELKKASKRLYELSDDFESKPEDIAAKAQDYLTTAFELDDHIVEVSEVVGDVYKAYIDEQVKGFSGLKTGFVDIDNSIGGLGNGELIVIGSDTGIGKSAFCLSISNNLSFETPMAYFSSEMKHKELINRLICMRAKVDLMEFRNYSFKEEKMSDIEKAVEELRDFKLLIDDKSSPTSDEITTKAKALKKRKDIKMLVVDHIQRLGDKARSYEEQISEIAVKLKNLAMDLDIPVVALSQFSRYTRDKDGRPTSKSLYGSSHIETNADIIVLMHKPSPEGSENGIREMIVSKNRSGPKKIIDMGFKPEYTQFYCVEQRREDEIPGKEVCVSNNPFG